ncbi:carbonic anhydrase [Atractiella rhizophila]|nr:carbonic anhydrase [Atractiella rhizophila]
MAAISTFPQDILNANQKYAENEHRQRTAGKLDSIPPSKQLIVLTCMDARLDPLANLGLVEGEAHIIRNAGGLAKDAIRSIVLSQLLGARKIAIFRHSDCGMLTFEEPQAKDLLVQRLGSAAEEHLTELALLPFSNLEESLKEDVAFLKAHPLVDPETEIVGFIYQLQDGRVKQVL